MPGALPAVTVPSVALAAVLAAPAARRPGGAWRAPRAGVAARALVGVDDRLAALRVADRDGRELGVEPARVLRGDRPLVALEREGVLVLAADVVLDRDALGVGAHVAVVDGAPEAVEDGRVADRRRRPAGSRSAPCEQVRRGVHVLHAARDDSSASPARISAAASMIDLMPEPQTRLIVVAGVVTGRPGRGAAPGARAPGRRRPG